MTAAPSAQAGFDVVTLPESFRYKHSAQPLSEELVQKDLDRILPVFDLRGLTSVATGDDGKRVKMLELDDVYSDFDCDQMILAKWNIGPEDASFYGKIIKDDDTYLFHGKTPAGTPYTIFYGNTFSQEQVARISAEIQDHLADKVAETPRRRDDRGRARSHFLSLLAGQLFPEAYAETDGKTYAPDGTEVRRAIAVNEPEWKQNARGCSAGRSPASGLGDVKERLEAESKKAKSQNKFLRFATSCIGAVGRAIINFVPDLAKDSFHMVIDVSRTAKDAFVPRDPSKLKPGDKIAPEDAFKYKNDFWTDVTRPFRMVWKGIVDLKKIPQGFMELGKSKLEEIRDPEKGAAVLGDIACSVITSIGIDFFLQSLAAGKVLKSLVDVAKVKKVVDVEQAYRNMQLAIDMTHPSNFERYGKKK